MQTEPMKTDPILQEVWDIKDQLAAEAGYDLNRFFKQLREWSAAHPHSGPIVHNAEELRQLVAAHEQEQAENLSLREEAPRTQE